MLLCLLLIVTAVAAAVPVGATEFAYPSGTEYAPNGESAGGNAKWFTAGHSVAYRINFATPVRNLHVQIVTASTSPNVTLTLYKWNSNYAKTVSAEPLASSTYTSISDNAYQNVVADADKVWAAGEYLIVLTTDNADGTTLKVGHQGKNLGESATGYYYVDGVEQAKGYAMRVEFIVCEDTNNPFGTIAPETYTYAADYQYHPDASASAGAPKYLAKDQSAGYRFDIPMSIDGLQVQLVTTGGSPNATLALYKWAGTYSATVSGTAVLSKTYDAVTNNQWYYVGNSTDIVNAGQYLLVISSANADGTDIKLGHQGKTNGDASVGYYYVNGEKQASGYDMRIWFDLVGGSDTLFDSLDINYRGCQVSDDIETADEFNIRFAATVDWLDYQNVGFEITAKVAGETDRTWTSTTKNVYTSLNAKSSDDKVLKTVTAKQLGGEYIVALTIKDVPADKAITFVVKPYVIGLDGVTEYGESWNVNVTAEGVVTNERAS